MDTESSHTFDGRLEEVRIMGPPSGTSEIAFWTVKTVPFTFVSNVWRATERELGFWTRPSIRGNSRFRTKLAQHPAMHRVSRKGTSRLVLENIAASVGRLRIESGEGENRFGQILAIRPENPGFCQNDGNREK
jgi:hypothetical protein